MNDKNKPRQESEQVNPYYTEQRVIEVWLFNGSILPVRTKIKPKKVKYFDINWLNLIDEKGTQLDIKLEGVAYIRNYTVKVYDAMLKAPKAEEETYG